MVLAVIPALNASASIGLVVERVARQTGPGSVIVVDDGSTDGTAETALAAGATVVRHPLNKGKGAALTTGFAAALSRPDTTAVITMDADLQHVPEEIPRFLAERDASRSDMVIGARSRRGTNMPLARRCSNILTSFLVTARTGHHVPDSQSGFRLIGREVLEQVAVRSRGYEAETEFLVKALRKGFRVSFVPVSTVYADEKSHMSHWHTTKRFLQILFEDT